MSKTVIKQYLQKRYNKVNDTLAEDMTSEDFHKLKGALNEIDNFISFFGVKIKRVKSIFTSEDNVG